MMKLIVCEIDNDIYTLKDGLGNIYKRHMEFLDLPNPILTGDVVFANKKLLDEDYLPLFFGPIDGKYGRRIKSEDDPDLLILLSKGKNVYLKRYYG